MLNILAKRLNFAKTLFPRKTSDQGLSPSDYRRRNRPSPLIPQQ